MKRMIGLLSMLCFLALSGQASAVSISLIPSTQTIQVGDTASVDLKITLTDQEFLDGFDFALLFDPAVLAFDSVVWNSVVESDYLAGATYAPGPPAGNVVTMNGFYDYSGTQLTNDTVKLATLSFTGIGLGTSALTMPTFADDPTYGNYVMLSDLSFPDVSARASVNVAPVPEPGTLILLGSGLAGLAGYGRKRKKG